MKEEFQEVRSQLEAEQDMVLKMETKVKHLEVRAFTFNLLHYTQAKSIFFCQYQLLFHNLPLGTRTGCDCCNAVMMYCHDISVLACLLRYEPQSETQSYTQAIEEKNAELAKSLNDEIGRASCRERV